MKKLLFTLAVVLSFSVLASAGNNSKYFINDDAVNQIFASSTEIDFTGMQLNSFANNSNDVQIKGGNDAVVATIICCFVGYFGIHRHYLGTRDDMWMLYTFSCCGILGFVPFVDFCVLLINGVLKDEGVGEYKNNKDFIMW